MRTAPETLAVSATILPFVSNGPQARRYFVSGLVQGVGFRFFTQHAAERMHLSGYARNLRDGRVEVFATGAPEQLAQLRAALERGPRFATVRQVLEEAAEPDAAYGHNFVIEESE